MFLDSTTCTKNVSRKPFALTKKVLRNFCRWLPCPVQCAVGTYILGEHFIVQQTITPFTFMFTNKYTKNWFVIVFPPKTKCNLSICQISMTSLSPTTRETSMNVLNVSVLITNEIIYVRVIDCCLQRMRRSKVCRKYRNSRDRTCIDYRGQRSVCCVV